MALIPFRSERDRLAHPQAARIPKVIWDQIGGFTSDLAVFMQSSQPLEDLERLRQVRHAKGQRIDSITQSKFWFAFSCSESSPDDEQLMRSAKILDISDDELCAMAALTRRGSIVNSILQSSSRERALNIIRADNYRVFRDAVAGGDVELIKSLMAVMPDDDIPFMVDRASCLAAEGGDMGVMHALMDDHRLSEERALDIIRNRFYQIFSGAASFGHLEILKDLMARVPDNEKPVMIRASVSQIFRVSAAGGHLNVVRALMADFPGEVLPMIKAGNYSAFRDAASADHLDVIQELMKHLPDEEVLAMIQARGVDAITAAVMRDCVDVTNYLLNFPNIFSFIEIHAQEPKYRCFVERFMTQKLQALKARQAADHPTVVCTQQEAQLCFYMLRHLMRETLASAEELENIEFLLSLSIVSSILHRPMLEGPTNEPLRQALRLDNRSMINSLMQLPNVAEQARQDGYYETERSGGIDLRTFSRNKESSMVDLSAIEQAQLQRLKKVYQSRIDLFTMQDLMSELEKRYCADPAIIVLENGAKISLPLSRENFDVLPLSVDEKTRANIAYYQHPTHTAYRYLSKPNLWISPEAIHAGFDEQRRVGWSIFKEQELLRLLWIAATDHEAPPTDLYTVEDRIQALIQEIALIGRAHNWDKTNAKGEDYDDLEGDKPSCSLGVKRRLFQALKGHPFYADIQGIIEAYLSHQLREQVARVLTTLTTHTLEGLLSEYAQMTRTGRCSEALINISNAFTPSEANLKRWDQAFVTLCTEKFGKAFMENAMTSDIIETVRKAFFQTSSTTNLFLEKVVHCQLHALCMVELKSRADYLLSMLRLQSADQVLTFLNEIHPVTQQSRCLLAIELGLLHEVGALIGPKRFAALLCKDDAALKGYAELLAGMSPNEKTLQSWLEHLDEVNRARLLGEIKAVSHFSAQDSFSIFLRSEFLSREDDQNSPWGRKIAILIMSLKGKKQEYFEKTLKNWLDQQPEPISEFVQKIHSKAVELKLMNQPRQSSEIELVEASVISTTAYDRLPNDPAGRLLMKDVMKNPGRCGIFGHTIPASVPVSPCLERSV